MAKGKYEKLRRSLRWGDQAKIARMYGESPSYVNQVLFGRINNDEILTALFNAGEAEKKRQMEIKQKERSL